MQKLLLFILTVCGLLYASELPKEFQIIPQPLNIQLTEQNPLPVDAIHGIYIQYGIDIPILGEHLSKLPLIDEKTNGAILLTSNNVDELENNSEGYILEITSTGVQINAISAAGLFYGCQTLDQMLEDAKSAKILLPSCRIVDLPAYEFRAVHFDVKHHLDQMHYYYENIDRLARYKINAIVFEFEDKLRYKRRPVVGATHAISIEEIQALTQYAADRHIEIVPLVQGLGHATFILKHEKYVPLREQPENHWAFCPLDPGTYEVLFDLYLDAMEATPNSRYFHVGGDEVGSIGICDRCKGYGKEHGQIGLNLYWLNKVCDFVKEQGRIPIYWDDMLFKEAGLWQSVQRGENDSSEQTEKVWKEGLDKLLKMRSEMPQDAVYMRWNYGNADNEGSGKALDFYVEQKMPAMIATAAQTTNELLPGLERTATIKRFSEYAYKHGITGSLCTSWDDSSPLMELYWRGWVTSAEYTWAPGKRNMDEFLKAMFQREFGLDVYPVYEKLYKGIEFWNRAYFKSGTRRTRANAMVPIASASHWTSGEKIEFVNNSEKFIGLPDPEHPGTWSETYREKLNQAQTLVDSYKADKAMLEEMLKNATRNRYGIEVLIAIHELQSTTPRLFLALEASDTKDKSSRKAGINQLEKEIMNFGNTAGNLEQVYGKIRFLNYPSDYLKDRYFHWASQAEDISFMFAVEQSFHQYIKEWLTEK